MPTQICKSLGLLEKEYFGLCYEDKSGDRLWVNLRNPLSEQLPQGNRVIMEMRVKYFISPHKILQPVTRWAQPLIMCVWSVYLNYNLTQRKFTPIASDHTACSHTNSNNIISAGAYKKRKLSGFLLQFLEKYSN